MTPEKTRKLANIMADGSEKITVKFEYFEVKTYEDGINGHVYLDPAHRAYTSTEERISAPDLISRIKNKFETLRSGKYDDVSATVKADGFLPLTIYPSDFGNG